MLQINRMSTVRNYTVHILERNVRTLNDVKSAVTLFLDIKSDFDA